MNIIPVSAETFHPGQNYVSARIGHAFNSFIFIGLRIMHLSGKRRQAKPSYAWNEKGL